MLTSLQQVSLEIREQFKAGEHVVFGAHVDENMGDHVQIIVLGATDLEAGLSADVAPVAGIHAIEASPKTKQAHQSKLKAKKKAEAKVEAKKAMRPSLLHERRENIPRIRTCSISWRRATSCWYF